MEKTRKNRIKRVFTTLNWLRIVTLNLFFWGVVIILLISVLSRKIPTKIPKEDGVLTIELKGLLVEESSSLSTPFTPNGTTEILYYDVAEAVRIAATDSRIREVSFDLSELYGGSFSALNDIGRAITLFRENGKRVTFHSNNYNTYTYYLASFGDSISIDPMGNFWVRGFSLSNIYYKGGMDKLGLKAVVFRQGRYKSAIEPFTTDQMSQPVKENYQKVLSLLWQEYLHTIAYNRGLPPEAVETVFKNYHNFLKEKGGDSALLAESYSLVNKRAVRQPSELNDTLKIDMNSYLLNEQPRSDLPQIAVINITGTIISGESYGDFAGDRTISKLIETANSSDAIEAIVLRVDSGGGSSLASEEIRRAIEKTTDCISCKPIVVSFGDRGASGAYWLATAASAIVAEKTTLTGSIGVFSLLVNSETLMTEKLGVTGDGLGTTPYSNDKLLFGNINQPTSTVFQLSVDKTYRDFLKLVSQSRGIDPQSIEAVAGGRVFTGGEALEVGLADRLGGLYDAISEAARLRNIQNYRVVFMQRPKNFWEEAASFAQELRLSSPSSIEIPNINRYIDIANLLKKSNGSIVLLAPEEVVWE